MRGEVKEEILGILKKAIVLVKLKDSTKLKELSDSAIYTASIYQDGDSVSIAVIIYALSKLMERIESPDEVCKKFCQSLARCYDLLSKGDYKRYSERIKSLFGVISDFDDKFRVYVQDVIQKALIKKGSMIYGKGISMAQAASVLGISQWDLMDYAGNVEIPLSEKTFTVDSRLKYTRELFGL